MDKTDVPTRIWKEVIDPPSRSVYYWNVLTGETTWENPVKDDIEPLSFHEKVSHHSKVIVDKLDHKVDRTKFFFDEINLISDVCNHLRGEDLGSVKELIEMSLSNLNKLLDIATPKTKSYNKFLDLKKFLTEQKSYLKNNSYISDEVCDRIKDVSEEIGRNIENIKRFHVDNDQLLDGYKMYIEKRKLDPIDQPNVSSNQVEKSPEHLSPVLTQSTVVKHDKKSILKSIHERWNRASEIIDESENGDDFNSDSMSPRSFNVIGTDQDNPNLVPISKPWYEKED